MLSAIKNRLIKFSGIILFLYTLAVHAADKNPFPSISVEGGDFEKTVGTHLETALKYALVGVGGLLVLICIGVLIHRLREDSREKDHGNLIMTFIMLAMGTTIGFILIGIGWTAFSAQI